MMNGRRMVAGRRARSAGPARPWLWGQWHANDPGRLVTVTLLALAGCVGADDRGAEVGDRVPEYSAPDLAGQQISLASQQGKVVLVHVWATWCGPCRVEMPPIQAVYERYRERGFNVLAIAIDAGPGYREDVEEFVDELGLTFPILLDPDARVSRIFQTVGVPETFVLDREGRIVKRLIGASDWNSPENQALIEELLRM